MAQKKLRRAAYVDSQGVSWDKPLESELRFVLVEIRLKLSLLCAYH
jgi:hypothetical protein